MFNINLLTARLDILSSLGCNTLSMSASAKHPLIYSQNNPFSIKALSFRCGTRPVIYQRKVQHLLTFSKWTSASRDAHKENIHKVEQRTLSSYPSRQKSTRRVEGRSLDGVVVEPLNDRRYPSRPFPWASEAFLQPIGCVRVFHISGTR